MEAGQLQKEHEPKPAANPAPQAADAGISQNNKKAEDAAPVEIRPIEERQRGVVNAFLQEHWLATTMYVRGQAVDMTRLPAFAAWQGQKLAGLVTYARLSLWTASTAAGGLVQLSLSG